MRAHGRLRCLRGQMAPDLLARVAPEDPVPT
jgi:hypothetical protein